MNTKETNGIKRPSKATIKKWADLTDINAHTDCLIAKAVWFYRATGDEWFNRIVSALVFINSEHDRIGYLPAHLDILRYCTMKELHARVRQYIADCDDIISC